MERFAENPIIDPAKVKPSRPDFEVVGAFNAGCAQLGKEIILLMRVAERPVERLKNFLISPIWKRDRGQIEIFSVPTDDPDLVDEDERVFKYKGEFYLTSISHLRVARSEDGIHFRVEDKPAMVPEEYTEAYGLEDPRITQIGNDYWITYKVVSEHGICTALAQTADFVSFTRHGIIFCPENLDVVIFPEKLGGQYAAWTRPVARHIGLPAIWVARSPDLVHWGAHRPVLSPRSGMWDSARVGSSTVPFRTAQGWIEIYHGADADHRYCVGVALIDGDDPSRVIARSRDALMQPETPYELKGFFGHVVFPCGAAVKENGEVLVYYGAADMYTCGARTTVDELLAHVKPNS